MADEGKHPEPPTIDFYTFLFSLDNGTVPLLP